MSARERLLRDFEAWAEVSAALLDQPLEVRLEILERVELAPRDFDEIDAVWSRTLMAELSRGETANAEAYGRRCGEELSARRRNAVAEDGTLPIESLGRGGVPVLPFKDSQGALESTDARPKASLGDGSDGDTVEVALSKLARPATPFKQR